MSPSVLLVPLLTFSLVTAGPVRGDAAGRAEAAFDAGDYETAAKAAAQAYADEGDPIYLYVRAQAERFGGRCALAIEHYQQFIEAVPKGEAAAAARDNIDECEAVLAHAEPAPDPIDPITPADPTAPVRTEPEDAPDDRPRPTHWARDPLGGALVGLGGAALAIGGGLYGKARADERSAGRATDVLTYGERIDRAYTFSRVGVSMMVVGGALLVGSAVRWAVLARRGRRGEPTHAWRARAFPLQPSPTGLVLRF